MNRTAVSARNHARNAEIVRLAANGMSINEIVERSGLRHAHIKRVVKRAMKRRAETFKETKRDV